MDAKERETIVKYGESVGLKVTPMELDGKHAVAYMDHVTFDPVRALNDIEAFDRAKVKPEGKRPILPSLVLI